mgnify:FL=1|tara:strand:+ start:80 stop:385 length:306 start_codon:yes stop_codon:yes gene_type:complete
MKAILIILGILAVGAAVYFYFYKTGKINDRDGDYIPDEVEDAVDEGKAKVKKTVTKVKRRAKRVKEELSDVGDAIKEVGSQLKDVGQAAKGRKRSGRKPKK